MTQRVETGGWRGQGQPGLHSRTLFQKTKQQTNKDILTRLEREDLLLCLMSLSPSLTQPQIPSFLVASPFLKPHSSPWVEGAIPQEGGTPFQSHRAAGYQRKRGRCSTPSLQNVHHSLYQTDSLILSDSHTRHMQTVHLSPASQKGISILICDRKV